MEVLMFKKSVFGLLILVMSLTWGCSNKSVNEAFYACDRDFDYIVSALIEKGFDLKVVSKESCLIITEYKQYSAVYVEKYPPFDFSLQLKIQFSSNANGFPVLIINPTVKEVNRMNTAAYTEHETIYINKEPVKQSEVLTNYAFFKGQAKMMEVIIRIAEVTGFPMSQIVYKPIIWES